MAEQSTYIKLDRNILKWRWWHHHNTLIVFLTLLMNANIQEHPFKEVNIRRGEVATSIPTLCQQANLTPQQVRTAISHLKSTGEITAKVYSKFQVITIVNYDKYQKSTGKLTGNQQATNRQPTCKLTAIKEYNIKNDKNEKNNTPLPPKGGKTPSGNPERGTDAFRNQSHLLLNPDEGTEDDIPVRYREMFNGDFAAYWGYRNQ